MTEAPEESPQNGSTEGLLADFRTRRDRLDQRLLNLEQLITDLRLDLKGDSQTSLKRLAEAAQDMANGRVYQQIDIKAKGELGALVSSINQTLLNLLQLDAPVKHQSTQAPELAAQLDAITSDAEESTQNFMNRLDILMAASEDASWALQACQDGIVRMNGHEATLHAAISRFLDRAADGENQTAIAQEVLEYLFAHQVATPTIELDLSPAQDHLQKVSDEAFEILNILQFQDITRQKIEKVVLLLKQFQSGLTRLLKIFNIEPEALSAAAFSDRRAATQDRIFGTGFKVDSRKDSLDDIIAQFMKTNGS